MTFSCVVLKCKSNCPSNFQSVFCRHYVDDIFALNSSPDHHADNSKEYLFCHINIPTQIFLVSREKEKDGCLSFLDV